MSAGRFCLLVVTWVLLLAAAEQIAWSTGTHFSILRPVLTVGLACVGTALTIRITKTNTKGRP